MPSLFTAFAYCQTAYCQLTSHSEYVVSIPTQSIIALVVVIMLPAHAYRQTVSIPKCGLPINIGWMDSAACRLSFSVLSSYLDSCITLSCCPKGTCWNSSCLAVTWPLRGLQLPITLYARAYSICCCLIEDRGYMRDCSPTKPCIIKNNAIYSTAHIYFIQD